ncbi:MAG: beta-ketoacyl-ACP synthase II [Oligoflexales bacterium]
MKRVVVTGVGMIAPTGSNVKEAWNAAIEGRTGVDKIQVFDPKDLPVQIAAEVKNFDPSQHFDEKEARKTTRFVQFALVAGKEAIIDSGLNVEGNTDRYGCSIGVGLGALYDIEENAYILRDKGHRRVSPFFIPYAIANMAAGCVSMAHNLKGPNLCPTTACASGTHGVGEGYLHILNDYADVMLCGGAESTISPLGITSFAALKALSRRNDDPKGASRPFDTDRDGFVMGEGSGLLVLEELEHAKRRGAKIYAEIVGYGMSGDAYHITQPSPNAEGGQRCMRIALNTGKINPADVDYINAHGTSTKMNDHFESVAIETVFGDAAKKISISSTKGVTGHCIAAAGGIEAIYTVLATKHNLIPPTINYQTPDPDCRLDYTPNTARERKVNIALSNSFGFGGTNATIAVKKFT